jgi:hypothetical protein
MREQTGMQQDKAVVEFLVAVEVASFEEFDCCIH